MIERRAILLTLFIFAFVVLSLPEEEYSIGISAKTIDDTYSIVLSFPPFSFIPLSIVVGLFIYAARSKLPIRNNSKALSLKRRLLCFLIDFPINTLVAIIPVTLMALLINWYQSNEFSWLISRPYNPSTDRIYFLPFAIGVIIVCVLFGYPISRKKQSVGGIITNSLVVPSTNISLTSATLRSFFGFITLAAGAITIPAAWADKDKKFWHDDLFDTMPIQIIET